MYTHLSQLSLWEVSNIVGFMINVGLRQDETYHLGMDCTQKSGHFGDGLCLGLPHYRDSPKHQLVSAASWFHQEVGTHEFLRIINKLINYYVVSQCCPRRFDLENPPEFFRSFSEEKLPLVFHIYVSFPMLSIS